MHPDFYVNVLRVYRSDGKTHEKVRQFHRFAPNRELLELAFCQVWTYRLQVSAKRDALREKEL
jgi:hypothetical protein